MNHEDTETIMRQFQILSDKQKQALEDAYELLEPMGTVEIASFFDVSIDTVYQWKGKNSAMRYSEAFPTARGVIGGRQWWDFNLDVLPWGMRTGRCTQSGEPIKRKGPGYLKPVLDKTKERWPEGLPPPIAGLV